MGYTGSYDLGPRNIDGPRVDLFYGSSIHLKVSISEANKDVFFYITDSHEEVVFDAGRIYDGYSLDWSSHEIGSRARMNSYQTVAPNLLAIAGEAPMILQ